MVSEVWTAARREETDKKSCIIFEVKDEDTGSTREEMRYEDALPLMMRLGGYPSVMAGVMLMMPLPWCFRKVGDNIYIDSPSIDVENYHPIIEQGADEAID